MLTSREELFVVLDAVDGAPQAADRAAGLADGLLVLSGLRSGLRALGHLVEYEQGRARLAAAPAYRPESTAAVASSFARGPDVNELLRAAGFALARGGLAGTARDAVSLGDEFGYPVVAKIADGQIAHKSDIGGVLIDLRSAGQLAEATDRLLSSGAARILVQEQITDGVEMFLGLQSASGLGTFILAGLGGIWAELVDDVQIRPVGLRDGEAQQMVRQLRGYRQLTGARGRPPVSLEVVAEAIMRLDAIGLAVGDRIESLDINPLIIRGDDAIVVDALLIERKHDDDGPPRRLPAMPLT